MFMSTSQPSYLCSLSMRHKSEAKLACQDEQLCKVKVRILYFAFSQTSKIKSLKVNSLSINDFLSSISMFSGGGKLLITHQKKINQSDIL